CRHACPPIKHPKDREGHPTDSLETMQVWQLLTIDDQPVPGLGKKPIQHPTYKQIRDTIIAFARQRTVYFVKLSGYINIIRDLVYGNAVPHLNNWITHWADRETPATEGENFYAYLFWLV